MYQITEPLNQTEGQSNSIRWSDGHQTSVCAGQLAFLLNLMFEQWSVTLKATHRGLLIDQESRCVLELHSTDLCSSGGGLPTSFHTSTP